MEYNRLVLPSEAKDTYFKAYKKLPHLASQFDWVPGINANGPQVAKVIADEINAGRLTFRELDDEEVWAVFFGVSASDGASDKDYAWRGGYAGRHLMPLIIPQITRPEAVDELVALCMEGNMIHNIVTSDFTYQGPKYVLFTRNAHLIGPKEHAVATLERILRNNIAGVKSEFLRYGPWQPSSFIAEIIGQSSYYVQHTLKSILMEQAKLAQNKKPFLFLLNANVGIEAFLEGIQYYLDAREQGDSTQEYLDHISFSDAGRLRVARVYFEFISTHPFEQAIHVARDYAGMVDYDFIGRGEPIGGMEEHLRLIEQPLQAIRESKDPGLRRLSAYVVLGAIIPSLKWLATHESPEVLAFLSEEAVNNIIEGEVQRKVPQIFKYPPTAYTRCLQMDLLIFPDSERYLAQARQRLASLTTDDPEVAKRLDEFISSGLSDKYLQTCRERMMPPWI